MWMKNMEHEAEVHRVYRLRLNTSHNFGKNYLTMVVQN